MGVMGVQTAADSRKTKAELLDELAALQTRLAVAEAAAASRVAGTVERALLAAIQRMPDGLACFDGEDRLVFCNDRYREIYAPIADSLVPGTSFAEILAAAIDRGMHNLGGEDPRLFASRRMTAHRAGATFEHRFRDGRIFQARDHLLEGGGLIGVRIDITEQRQAEQALRESEAFVHAILRSSADGVIVADARGRIVLMNPSAERILACESAEAVGREIERLFVPEEHVQDYRHVLRQYLNYGALAQSDHRMNFEARRFDGERFPAELSIGMAARGDEAYFIWFLRDISVRRNAEAALERSEANLRALMDHTQVALHLKRPDGRFIVANRRYLEWSGRPDPKIAGLTNEEANAANPMMDATVDEAIRRQEAEMMRTGAVVTREYELSNGNEDNQFWEITKFPVRGLDGTILAIGSTGIEITRTRRAEIDLRRQKMLMQAILDHTPVALTLSDAKGRFALVNREFCRRYGLTETEVIGRTGDELFADDRYYSAETVERMRRLRQTMIETRGPAADEWIVRFTDGLPRIVAVTRFPICDEDGRLLFTGSTAIDVTEMRAAQAALERSEANLRALMDHTQVALVLKDRDGRLILANRRFLDWCGLTADQAIGRTNAEIHGVNATADGGNIRDLGAQEDEVLRSGEAVTREIEMRSSGRDAEHWVVTKFPVRDAAGRIVAIGTTGIEVTETRRAEAALRRQAALTQTILDHTPVALTLWDGAGRFALANGEFYRRYGLSESDVIGRTSAEIFADGSRIGPDALKTMHDLRERALDTGLPQTAECTVRYADGSRHTVLQTRFPIRDEDGCVLYAGSTVTDITEVRQAEVALRRSEALLRTVLDNLPLTVTLKGLDGRYLLANRLFEARFGPAENRLSREVVGPLFADLGDNQDRRAIELDSPVTEERAIEIPGTGSLYRSMTKFPVRDADGTLIGVGSVATDITELRRAERALRHSEALLRTMLDNLPSMVTLKSLDGRYLLANRAVEAHFGPALGRATEEVADARLAEMAGDQQRRVLALDRAVSEEHVYESDGDRRTYRSVTKFPVRDADGGLIGVGSISTDITELKETQARLVQAQKMEAVGQLTGGIAHDFNNLLQVVIGNLSLLAEQPIPGEAVDLIEAAGRAARRGAEVTHQLLAFGRRQTLRPRVIDPDGLIGDLVGLFRRAIGGRADIVLELGSTTWPVRVDPGQLQSALLNLCINARDAMPEGGALTIASANLELGSGAPSPADGLAPGRYVVLSVIDHGVGMTEEVLAHALDPFFTTKEIGQGSGLGLSMVYGFIRQSGGDLRILSEVGHGTTVELYLPAAEPVAGAVGEAAEHGEPSGLKVLLVGAGVGPTTGAMLETLGCRVLASADLDTAISAADRHHPIDLLVIETGPGGPSDAAALARAVRARTPGVPVLYVSGTAGAAAATATPWRAGTVLLRPFGPDALRDKIVEALTT